MSIDSHIALIHEGRPDAPLVFAFHGTGGDEHQLAGLARQILPEASLVSPRGPVSEQGANRFFRRTGEGVYDMADLAMRTEAMAGFIAAHKNRHPGAPLYGFGYSNGANILASVVLQHPGLFDRVALLHPLIPWTPGPVSGLDHTRVLISAGQQDPICPWPLTDRLIAWFADQGAAVETEIHSGGHELRDGEVQSLGRFLRAS